MVPQVRCAGPTQEGAFDSALPVHPERSDELEYDKYPDDCCDHDLHVDDGVEAEGGRAVDGRVVHLPEHPEEKRDDRASGERRQRAGHALRRRGVCHWIRILHGRTVWGPSAAVLSE